MLRKVVKVVFVLVFAVFCQWYGTGNTPITLTEAVDKVKACGGGQVGADTTKFLNKLLKDDDSGQPFVMLNLVKLKNDPFYGDMPQLKPDWVKTGKDADFHYSQIFLPAIFKRASHPFLVFTNITKDVPIMFPKDIEVEKFVGWHYFALVRYRSRRDLVDAVCDVTQHLGPSALAILKYSGIDRTVAMPLATPWISYVMMGLVGILLFVNYTLLAYCCLRREKVA